LRILGRDGLVRHAIRFRDSMSPLADVAWSPDSTVIAYTLRRQRLVAGTWRTRDSIATVRADGSSLRLLTHAREVQDLSPNWSPDGKWIVFERARLRTV